MQNVGSEALTVGDRVSAAGLLVQDGPAHRLIIRGEGLYGELLNATEYATVPVSALTQPPLDQIVTLHGVWTGAAIVGSCATAGGRGVQPPEALEPSRFADVNDVDNRSDILRSDVLDACETIRGGALLAFVAARGPNGWFGLASAVDVAAVHDVLDPLLGTHLHVVPSDWSLDELNKAQEAGLAAVEPYEFGFFWDADGRFRAEMLVHHISPALASVVDQLPADILHVETWLRREE